MIFKIELEPLEENELYIKADTAIELKKKLKKRIEDMIHFKISVVMEEVKKNEEK